MTLRLILTRHCKSDWGDPMRGDKERTLNGRGKTDAPLIGNWLKTNNYLPEIVLCSTAVRTQETLLGLGFDHAPIKTLSDKLYLAEPDEILECLTLCGHETVQIIAHNPGIGSLANMLLEVEPDHPDFFRYPTGATTIVDFNGPNWRERGTGRCIAFVVPRDLKN